MNPDIKVPARVAEINAEIARQGNKDFSVAPSAPTYVPPTTINSSVLSSNEAPLTLPPTQPATAAAGLSGITSSVMEQGKSALLQQAEKDKIAKEAEAKASTSALKSTMDKTLEALGMKPKLKEEAKIGEKSQKVTDYTNQLESLERAELNEIRALDNQSISQSAKAQQQQQIQRQYAFQKADVALLQSAANRDLQTAEMIVKNKMDAVMEPLKLQLDFEKFFYSENKEALTKAEQREFDLKIQADERQYKSQQDLENTRSQMLMSAVSQNAPASVIQAINKGQTRDEIIQGAGIYAGDVMQRETQRLQQEKLRAEIGKIKADGKPTTPINLSTPQGQLAGMAQNLASKYGTKFAQESFLSNVNRLAQSGKEQELADYIFSEAISQIPDSESRKKALSQYKITNKLNELETQLAAYVALNGDTNLFKGKREDIINKLGASKDPALAQLGISMLDTLDQLARDRTGAVISESEEKFYDRLLPSTRKTAELNQAVINGLRSSLTTDLNSMLSFQLTGSGFKTIESYLGFQAGGNVIEMAKQGKVQIAPDGSLILITN